MEGFRFYSIVKENTAVYDITSLDILHRIDVRDPIVGLDSMT